MCYVSDGSLLPSGYFSVSVSSWCLLFTFSVVRCNILHSMCFEEVNDVA